MWPSPGCHCKTPRPSSDPRRQNSCVVCGRLIHHKEWSSSNIRPILDRLTNFPDVRWSKDYIAFRDLCFSREKAGRESFGYRFLGRDNERDTLEEIADGVNYGLFSVIRRKREEEEPLDDIALQAAYYAFKWFQTVLEIKRRAGGAP